MKRRFNVYSDSNSKDIVDELNNWNYNQFEDFEDICDLLNKLYDENRDFKNVIKETYFEVENSYDMAVRAGMPTGGTVMVMDILNEIAKKLNIDLYGE